MFKSLSLLALSLTLGACVDDPTVTTPELPPIQGIWRFTETMSAAARQTSCANTSSMTLRGDPKSFEGSYWQSGYCADQFAIFDSSTEGVIKAGSINGDVVSWKDSGCTYIGRLHRNRMSGSVTCRLEEDGEAYAFSGSWSATR